jgi:hypothetical protein
MKNHPHAIQHERIFFGFIVSSATKTGAEDFLGFITWWFGGEKLPPPEFTLEFSQLVLPLQRDAGRLRLLPRVALL